MKWSAPCSVRKEQLIFWLTFIFRIPLRWHCHHTAHLDFEESLKLLYNIQFKFDGNPTRINSRKYQDILLCFGYAARSR